MFERPFTTEHVLMADTGCEEMNQEPTHWHSALTKGVVQMNSESILKSTADTYEMNRFKYKSNERTVNKIKNIKNQTQNVLVLQLLKWSAQVGFIVA